MKYELTKEEDLKTRVSLLELVICLEIISVVEGIIPHIAIIDPKLKNEFIVSEKDYKERYGKDISVIYEVLHKISSKKYKLYSICLNERRNFVYMEYDINVYENVYNTLYVNKLHNRNKYYGDPSIGELRLKDGTVVKQEAEDGYKPDYKFVRYLKYPNDLIEKYVPLSQEYNYYIKDIMDSVVNVYGYYTMGLYDLYV